ncbi:MAG: type 2 isopentenyl-diphosphate Delta-isomerase [Actinobacteria bacterium]|nr:type 2 isopentenyl-diphosphate Delta-isomerase [Actinomycetota bacterium]
MLEMDNDSNSKKIRMNHTRKGEHLKISIDKDVQFKNVTTGFENYSFVHQALPELDLEKIDTSIQFLGKHLRVPIIISSMTGGIKEARQINLTLARAAQEKGLAMGVGSQRAAIDNRDVEYTYHVRSVAPEILLFANLGAVQLNYGYGLKECRQAVDMIDADGLIFHLNPLQEAFQVGGNSKFAGLLKKIGAICDGLDVPVVVKEVGWGISENVAMMLSKINISAIDVAGSGGTSWSEIEKFRTNGKVVRNVAESFNGWGIPTSESIKMVRRAVPHLPLVASGGIRTGIDVAKAIALGADAVGIAMPLFKAATRSFKTVMCVLEEIEMGLKIAMFCIGTGDIGRLKSTPHLIQDGRVIR